MRGTTQHDTTENNSTKPSALSVLNVTSFEWGQTETDDIKQRRREMSKPSSSLFLLVGPGVSVGEAAGAHPPRGESHVWISELSPCKQPPCMAPPDRAIHFWRMQLQIANAPFALSHKTNRADLLGGLWIIFFFLQWKKGDVAKTESSRSLK